MEHLLPAAPPADPVMFTKIKHVLGDAALPSEDANPLARSTQFELYVAALCARGGIAVRQKAHREGPLNEAWRSPMTLEAKIVEFVARDLYPFLGDHNNQFAQTGESPLESPLDQYSGKKTESAEPKIARWRTMVLNLDIETATA